MSSASLYCRQIPRPLFPSELSLSPWRHVHIFCGGMRPVGSGVFYALPQPILAHSVPLQTHVTLEPLPAFAETLGSAVLLSGVQVYTRSMRLSETCPEPDSLLGFKKPGRKVSSLNTTLRLFTRADPSHADKPPKLENIRYRVMRTLKKTLRRIFEHKNIKRRGLLDVELKMGSGEESFKAFKSFAKENRAELERFSQLVNGPKVDQSRRPQRTGFSTYNNSYMEHVFQSAPIRQVYLLFVGLVYSCGLAESLSKRFAINCCCDDQHRPQCQVRWEAFRELLDCYMGAKVPIGGN